MASGVLLSSSSLALARAVTDNTSIVASILSKLQSVEDMARASEVSKCWYAGSKQVCLSSWQVDLSTRQGRYVKHYIRWLKVKRGQKAFSDMSHLELSVPTAYTKEAHGQAVTKVITLMYKMCGSTLKTYRLEGASADDLQTSLKHMPDGIHKVCMTPHATVGDLMIPTSAFHRKIQDINMSFRGRCRGFFLIDVVLPDLTAVCVQQALTMIGLDAPFAAPLAHFLPNLQTIEVQLSAKEAQAVLDQGIHAKLQNADLALRDSPEALLTMLTQNRSTVKLKVHQGSKLRKLRLTGPEMSQVSLSVYKADIQCLCYNVALRYILDTNAFPCPFAMR